jgi:predicted nucleotidyltransferase
MEDNILLLVLKELSKVLKKHQINLVLMGGIAASILARPRSTFDIDGLISASEEEIRRILPALKKKGFKFDNKKPLKCIADLPFITLNFSRTKTYADLFIAADKFQKEVMHRAKSVKYNKIEIKIVTAEDLILIKLKSGREKDLEDVREILKENSTKLDYRYLKDWAKRLGVQMFLEDELQSLGIKK